MDEIDCVVFQRPAAQGLAIQIVAALLLLFVPHCWAGDVPAGDWVWNIDDPEAVHAGTENSAGNVLAQFCYPNDGSCIYVVSMGLDCKEGDSYTALVNTKSGATAIELLCGGEHDGESGSHLLVFQNFEEIDELVRKNSQIGFAIALAEGEFKAVRFSLRGSSQALDLMRRAAERLNEQAARKTKDSQTF